jgi:pyrimidine-nucleoside phosphorylase
MVDAQGGNRDWILHPELFPTATYSKAVLAPRNGYIASVDTEGYGIASLLLGAGRNTKEDTIDFAAGIRLCAKTGDFVKAGDPIAILYAEKESCFARAEAKLLEATHLGDVPPAEVPLILDVVE